VVGHRHGVVPARVRLAGERNELVDGLEGKA